MKILVGVIFAFGLYLVAVALTNLYITLDPHHFSATAIWVWDIGWSLVAAGVGGLIMSAK